MALSHFPPFDPGRHPVKRRPLSPKPVSEMNPTRNGGPLHTKNNRLSYGFGRALKPAGFLASGVRFSGGCSVWAFGNAAVFRQPPLGLGYGPKRNVSIFASDSRVAPGSTAP